MFSTVTYNIAIHFHILYCKHLFILSTLHDSFRYLIFIVLSLEHLFVFSLSTVTFLSCVHVISMLLYCAFYPPHFLCYLLAFLLCIQTITLLSLHVLSCSQWMPPKVKYIGHGFVICTHFSHWILIVRSRILM